MENSDSSVSNAASKAESLKSTNFTLSSLVFALFLTSNAAYAANTEYGDGAQATGVSSTATGQGAQAGGTSSTATGQGAQAGGTFSTATGQGAQAAGEFSTATGQEARAGGTFSTATGQGAQAGGTFSTATGQGAQATGTYSTATGEGAQATGTYSTATGQGAQATRVFSTATGYSAKAAGVNSVALGANSKASKDKEVNIGIWDYRSIQTETRTLSGLAAGTNDDEAVNVGQLKKVAKDANDYTDKQIKKLPSTGGISKQDAKQIAHDEVSGLNFDSKLSDVDNNAQIYASTAQAKAKDYTDDTAKKTLQSANENTERRTVVAENNAVTRSRAYTDESSGRTLQTANTYTNHRAAQAENNAVARSNNYTNQRFSALKQQVDRNEKRANGGIAGAMAMSAITGTGSGFGMAASGYRDQGAIAAGIQKSITPDTNVNLKVAWDSGNGVGVAAGFFTSW